MNPTLQAEIIDELRQCGETTLLTDKTYCDWLEDWLNRQSIQFTQEIIEVSIVFYAPGAKRK